MFQLSWMKSDIYTYISKVPFREAHSCAGKAVYIAETKNISLSELTVEDLQTVRSAGTFKWLWLIEVYEMFLFLLFIYLFLSFSPALCLTRMFLQCGTTSEVLNSTPHPVARRGVALQLKSSTLEPGYRLKNSNPILKVSSRCSFFKNEFGMLCLLLSHVITDSVEVKGLSACYI